jgi:nitrogenase molybdenum-iron protein NifN
MTEIIKRNKPLSVSPLKASSTLGAALAFLGLKDSIAMLHGAQGCTAYGKIYLIGHFREPVPLQTTALDQVSTVMGADDNVTEGLATICGKFSPRIIGVPTTGLSETQGSDTQGAVNIFRTKHPEYEATAVVAVETPDYWGSLESGFAKAVLAMIDRLVPDEAEARGGNPEADRVNLLVNASLSPADIEELKEIVEAFGLSPLVLPDLSDSLDGHLIDADNAPLTVGGFDVAQFAHLHESRATLVIGDSLAAAADLLLERTGVPTYRFDHLMGLPAVDALVDTLHRLTGRDVPAKLDRQRRQLQDTMLDAHFFLGLIPVALALDPDLLKGFNDLLAGMGARVVTAVAPTNAPVLQRLDTAAVKIGDLEDLETLAADHGALVVVGNAHCAAPAERMGLGLLRAGFPQYDRMGGSATCRIGYRGSRQTLFDLANLVIESGSMHLPPYRSIYAQVTDEEEGSDAGSRLRPQAHAH